MGENNKTTGIKLDGKTYVIGGRVVKVVNKRDVTSITGKDYVSPDDVAAVVQANGKEENEKDKEKGKFKAKWLLPLLAIPIILASVKSCEPKKDAEYNITTEKASVQVTIYDIENPSQYGFGLVNAEGQEEMTNDDFGVSEYDADQQFEDEERATEGVADFEELKKSVEYNMNILLDQNSTPQQRRQALENLKGLQEKAVMIYESDEDFAKDQGEKFKEQSEKSRDDNTDNESKAADLLVESYLEELGLANHNLSEISELLELLEQGFEIEEITGERQADGDWGFTVEAVREVVNGEDLEQAVDTYKGLASNIRENSGKKIQEGTQDIQGSKGER